MPATPEQLPVAEMLLALLALAPVLMAWGLGFFALKKEGRPSFRSANAFQLQDETPPDEQVADALLHLSRSLPAEQLRGCALGLRHAPVEQAAPLLRHFMRSSDPELSLYAQSTLQQGVEKLQHLANRLQELARRERDPRIAASLLECGLKLASPMLCKDDERAGRLRHLVEMARELLASCSSTPRLLVAGAEALLAAGLPGESAALVRQLPGSDASRISLEKRALLACRIQAAATPITTP